MTCTMAIIQDHKHLRIVRLEAASITQHLIVYKPYYDNKVIEGIVTNPHLTCTPKLQHILGLGQ